MLPHVSPAEARGPRPPAVLASATSPPASLEAARCGARDGCPDAVVSRLCAAHTHAPPGPFETWPLECQQHPALPHPKSQFSRPSKFSSSLFRPSQAERQTARRASRCCFQAPAAPDCAGHSAVSTCLTQSAWRSATPRPCRSHAPSPDGSQAHWFPSCPLSRASHSRHMSASRVPCPPGPRPRRTRRRAEVLPAPASPRLLSPAQLGPFAPHPPPAPAVRAAPQSSGTAYQHGHHGQRACFECPVNVSTPGGTVTHLRPRCADGGAAGRRPGRSRQRRKGRNRPWEPHSAHQRGPAGRRREADATLH